MPHKQAVLQHLDDVHYLARRIGAVDTIVNNNGELIGYNTDGLGVVRALEDVESPAGKRIAASSAREAPLAPQRARWPTPVPNVTIFARDLERGTPIANLCGGTVDAITHTKGLSLCDVIFNATPVGMQPDTEALAIDPAAIQPGQIVFDMVYAPHETRLLREAAARGARIVHGIEMLIYIRARRNSNSTPCSRRR